MMNDKESEVADNIGAALKALNEALQEAQELGLAVKVDSVKLQTFGQRTDREIYSAEVSKQAFVKRVG